MSVENGRLYGLYLATAAPAIPADSADAAYAACGLVTSLSLSEAINAIDISNKDSGNNSEFLGARSSWTVSVGARFDAADDTGQAKVTTGAESASRNCWFLITTDISADLEFLGKAVITSREYTLGDEESTEFSFALQVTGALTQAAVA